MRDDYPLEDDYGDESDADSVCFDIDPIDWVATMYEDYEPLG